MAYIKIKMFGLYSGTEKYAGMIVKILCRVRSKKLPIPILGTLIINVSMAMQII